MPPNLKLTDSFWGLIRQIQLTIIYVLTIISYNEIQIKSKLAF